MKFKKLKIEGAFIISPEPFIDSRGSFRRNFCFQEFKINKITNTIKQANISENKYKHTLRGFHYQVYPYSEAKTMTCFEGSIFDIIVDLRPKSKTYLKWVGFKINSKEKKSFHVPKGCANAFLTLEDNTKVHYYSSQFYHPKSERGIKYNDNFFNFEWPSIPKVISDKDKNWENFKS